MRNNIFIPEHKTNILPLRWLANYVFHYSSMFFFKIAMKKNDKYTYNWGKYNLFDAALEAVSWKLYTLIDIPYTKWGTYYVFKSSIVDEIKQDALGWDDYDEYGHAYWEYFWKQCEDGDAFRLIPYGEKNKNDN